MGDARNEGAVRKADNAGGESAQRRSRDLDTIVSEARSALGVLSGLHESLGAQLASLEQRDRDVKVQFARLSEDNERLNKDRSGFVTQREGFDKEKQALESRAVDLDKLEATVAKQIRLLENQQAATDSDLQKVTKEKAALVEERESIEALRAEFEANYGSSAEFAQKLESREKALAQMASVADRRECELAQATEELVAARAAMEAQSQENGRREEALRLREESVKQFREMLAAMRNGIDDPNADIGEAVAIAAAAERAAVAATQSAKARPVEAGSIVAGSVETEPELAGFSKEEIALAREKLGNVEISDKEIVLRLHARRTLEGASHREAAEPSKWKVPWLK